MCIMTVSLFPVRSQKSTTPEKPGERPDPAVIYEEKRIFFILIPVPLNCGMS